MAVGNSRLTGLPRLCLDSPVTQNEYLTTAEAARILGVSDETLRRWAEERKIRHTRLPSGRLRFTREDIASSLEVIEPEVQAS